MVMNNIELLVSIANVYFHLRMKTFEIMGVNVIGKNGLRVQNVIEIIPSPIVTHLSLINVKIDFS